MQRRRHISFHASLLKEKEMTMFQHAMLGNIILMFLWFVWIRHFFTTPQNQEDLKNEISKWFNKQDPL